MLFSNRIRCFVCSCIAFLGFVLNLNILKAIKSISYVVFYQKDYPMIWRMQCKGCGETIKGECCFIPYETDKPGERLFGDPLNQICLSCLEQNYLIPHLKNLKRTSNDRDDYVQKASMSIVEGSSKYMKQDANHGRPLCDICREHITLIKDDVIIISRDAHIHKKCLESIFESYTDGIIKSPKSDFRFANPPVVNIKSLIDKVWPLD